MNTADNDFRDHNQRTPCRPESLFADRDAEIKRLCQELDKRDRVIRILREAIMDAQNQGCACDWHLYSEDAPLIVGNYEKYRSDMDTMRMELLGEQRRSEALARANQELREQITRAGMTPESAEQDIRDLLDSYSDGLSA